MIRRPRFFFSCSLNGHGFGHHPHQMLIDNGDIIQFVARRETPSRICGSRIRQNSEVGRRPEDWRRLLRASLQLGSSGSKPYVDGTTIVLGH
jgi:hypothetical protein